MGFISNIHIHNWTNLNKFAKISSVKYFQNKFRKQFNFLIFLASVVKVDGYLKNCYCSVLSLSPRCLTSTVSEEKKNNPSVHVHISKFLNTSKINFI